MESPSDSVMLPFPLPFGILAVDKDLTVSEAVLISFTNLTSAGQFAGLTIIAELGTLVEMALSSSSST